MFISLVYRCEVKGRTDQNGSHLQFGLRIIRGSYRPKGIYGLVCIRLVVVQTKGITPAFSELIVYLFFKSSHVKRAEGRHIFL